ncbi:MAG TPA: cupin domain-containing protein [Vicinamibacterales bacterium]|jgi:quercetin dioxygenase-like cupin family protein
MKRVALVLMFALVVAASARWTRAQQPAAGNDDPRFTGKSDTLDAKDLGVGRRSFEAGARSAWHSHDKGQLLFVEQGRGRVQRKGEAVKELKVGDSDYTAPNVVHWHGAVPTERYVQVAISFGGDIKWMQKVTDAEYNAR